MRFLIAAALVLLSLCGCSSPIGVHNSDDFEYGDSSSVVKSKFPGKLIEHESIYLVGTTSVDSKSYGVTFTFFKDQLVSMFLCAKSHSNGKSADNNSMEINRDSDWDSNLE